MPHRLAIVVSQTLQYVGKCAVPKKVYDMLQCTSHWDI